MNARIEDRIKWVYVKVNVSRSSNADATLHSTRRGSDEGFKDGRGLHSPFDARAQAAALRLFHTKYQATGKKERCAPRRIAQLHTSQPSEEGLERINVCFFLIDMHFNANAAIRNTEGTR